MGEVKVVPKQFPNTTSTLNSYKLELVMEGSVSCCQQITKHGQQSILRGPNELQRANRRAGDGGVYGTARTNYLSKKCMHVYSCLEWLGAILVMYARKGFHEWCLE